MFNPSVADVRNFFFDTFEKGNQNIPLTDMEKIAFSVILEHPEYKNVLSNRDKYMTQNWLPEAGETNPFLHLSMHMSILEQLSVNQPFGVKELYFELCNKVNNEHDAQHHVMDCLAEMIWQAQYSNMQPNPQIYLDGLRIKINQL